MAKRAPIHTRKSFVDAEGNASRSAKPTSTILRFEFLAAPVEDQERTVAETQDIELASIPDTVQHCAFAYGLSQKLGDSYSGAAAEAKDRGMEGEYTSAVAAVIMNETLEDIMAGVWVEEREGKGAATVTILRQAIVAAFEKAGKPLPDGLDTKLADADYRKKAASLPAVDAEVQAIKLERQKARQKDAAAKAKDSAVDALGAL